MASIVFIRKLILLLYVVAIAQARVFRKAMSSWYHTPPHLLRSSFWYRSSYSSQMFSTDSTNNVVLVQQTRTLLCSEYSTTKGTLAVLNWQTSVTPPSVAMRWRGISDERHAAILLVWTPSPFSVSASYSRQSMYLQVRSCCLLKRVQYSTPEYSYSGRGYAY